MCCCYMCLCYCLGVFCLPFLVFIPFSLSDGHSVSLPLDDDKKETSLSLSQSHKGRFQVRENALIVFSLYFLFSFHQALNVSNISDVR